MLFEKDVAIKLLRKYYEKNDDEFEFVCEELDSWDGLLGDDRYYSMYELDDILSDKSPTEILESISDCFSTCDEYFRWTIYGLESTDYKEYDDYLDDYTMESLIDNLENICWENLPDVVIYICEHIKED